VPIIGARCTISQGVLLDIYHETRYLVRIAGRYEMIASDIRYGECSHSSRAQVKLHKTGTPGRSLWIAHHIEGLACTVLTCACSLVSTLMERIADLRRVISTGCHPTSTLHRIATQLFLPCLCERQATPGMIALSFRGKKDLI
jgi:hypothetical protein